MLTVGDLFSGIGGFSAGFDRAGCRTVWFCEIDRRCRDVLASHWPGVPCFGDVRTIRGRDLGAAHLVPDVLVGGFPCQDLSVAGRRAGLDGDRSGLWWEFARIIEEVGPEWVVIENVPGLLSSAGGRDMGTVLWTLADFGYRCAWRVLDAQWFGVPQRRRRVFIVGRSGDRPGAKEVLHEPEGGRGDPPSRRPSGSGAAAGVGGGAAGDGGDPYCFDWQSGGTGDTSFRGKSRSYPVRKPGMSGSLQSTKVEAVIIPETVQGLTGSFGNDGADDNKAQAGWLVPTHDVAPCLETMIQGVAGTLGGGSGTRGWCDDLDRATFIPTLLQERDGKGQDSDATKAMVVTYRKATKIHGPVSDQDGERWEPADVSGTFTKRDGTAPTTAIVDPNLTVRRLTPVECLRLQGFPDDWLDGLRLPDSAKYRMVGNAVAVPVVAWIARRLVAWVSS